GLVAPHDGAALPDELPGEERVLPAAEPERLFEAQAEAVDLPHVEHEVPGGRRLEHGARGALWAAERPRGDHPGVGVLVEDGDDPARDSARTGLPPYLDQAREPAVERDLVVVEEGEEIT